MSELTAQKREILGKGMRALRKQGLIPAELYGRETENQHLSLDEKEFGRVYKEAGENSVITLLVNGKKVPVIINDVIHDNLAGRVIHADFHAVKMDEKIEANIPLEFTGESMAVKSGGVLVKSMKEIAVEAFPQDLPHSIEVDLNKLEEVHQNIYVKDLKISDKVKILTDLETVIATVHEARKEEEAAPVVSVEDVKVEGEEKKKEKEEPVVKE